MIAFILIAAGMLPELPQSTALNLVISVQRPVIGVGEPVKIVATWSATEPIRVRKGAAQVLLDQGQGLRLWGEALPVYGTVLEEPQALQPGSVERTEHVVSLAGPTSRGAPYTLAFPVIGTYRVMVRYQLGAHLVSSNIATIVAAMPQGSDAALLELFIRPRPELLIAQPARMGRIAWLEDVFARFPGSRYLARAKVLFLEMLLYEAIGSAPDPSPASGPLQGDVPRLLERLATEDLGGSVFEEDRLVVLAQMRSRSGRELEAVEAWRELAEKYPHSASADEARKHLHR